ncbi:MAG: DUF6580 family putative transport protein [Chitinophagaceae bacterium]
MKSNRSTWIAFILLIVVAAFSRVMTYSVAGFAPQMAMAIFGGAVINDKKWAFALPLLSLLLSDLLLQVLFTAGISERAGFYSGQWAVYLCFAVLTVYGFLMKKVNVKNVLIFSVSGSVLFFIMSNFFVWLGGGGLNRPQTFEGLILCYGDALAYYRDYGLIKGFIGNSVLGELIWSIGLFGGFYLINKLSFSSSAETAKQQ